MIRYRSCVERMRKDKIMYCACASSTGHGLYELETIPVAFLQLAG